MTEQLRVGVFFRTGAERYHRNEQDWINGDLDAPEWIPCGSTIEIEPVSYHNYRLIADRLVTRDHYSRWLA